MNHVSRTVGHSYSYDAHRAIEALGEVADLDVATGFWLHVGEWLNWPDWLRDGTSQEGSGALPGKISVADDLLIAANIFEHMDIDQLVGRFLERSRPAFGPRTALTQLNGPTLGEVLSYTARLMDAHNPHHRVDFEVENEEAQFTLSPVVPLGELGDVLGLLATIAVYLTIQPLAQGQLGSVVLETKLPRARLRESSWSEFRCSVVAGGDLHRISMPREMAALRNPEFNPAYWSVDLDGIATIERASESAAIVRRVRTKVVDSLLTDRRTPRLKQIATEEGMSVRKVIRLLRGNDTSFHSIVEEERRQIAARLILDASIPLDGVSEMLGFTDRSSFGRSFRKWFGMPPGEYRNSLATTQEAGADTRTGPFA